MSDRNAKARARAAHLRHNDDLFPRDFVLFESLPKDDLRQAVGIRVGGIKGVDSVVESVPRHKKISEIVLARNQGIAARTRT